MEPVPVAKFDATPETIIEIALDVTTVPEAPEGPELEMVPADAIQSNPDGLPEWERDPTVAELRPDLDALEEAIAQVHGDMTGNGTRAGTAPDGDDECGTTIVDEIPEITLDDAIERGIAEDDGDEDEDTTSDPA